MWSDISLLLLAGVTVSGLVHGVAAREHPAFERRSSGNASGKIWTGQGVGNHSTSPLVPISTSITLPVTSYLPASSTSSLRASAATSTTATLITGKPVFFHYMVGTVYDAHCEQDIKDAQALGADAFALNLLNDSDSWSTDTVALLFKWANVYGFKLLFSFDMSSFSNPDQFTDFLLSYVTNDAYYYYNGLPFVSTFNGGASSFNFGQQSVNDGWQVQLKDVMATAGHPVYFIPAFQDVSASSDFFVNLPTLDGAMNWNSWPYNTDGKIIVPTSEDEIYQNAAKAANKTFLMGVSPLQFKHIDSSQNWYRRGEQNLEYRFGQVLAMQPDFIELQTWNDAGESHYMGNSWIEPISGTDEIDYTVDYDHTGYWEILPAFIKAFKAGETTTGSRYPTNGNTVQGVFWHHTLLVGADCSADAMGKPGGIDTAEDSVTAVILVEPGYTTYQVTILSSNRTLGMQPLIPGYNKYSVSGLGVGNVTVSVVNAATREKVLSVTGPLPVTNSSTLCNYNFQVVALS